MVSRNPFRVRASEYLEEENEFLSLFGLDALDIFNVDDMWTKIQIIRSARGGGKTSILRIFNPKSLNEIYYSRNDNKLKFLYNRLKELDVYSEQIEGPKVLGINLSLFGNYPVLNQLGFDFQKQMKLCYALISCRIILATLRSVIELKNLEFPDDLNKIYFKKPTEPNISTSIPLPCTGDKLYDWASKIETKISNIIEEDETDDSGLNGFETFSILHIIRSKNIIFDNSPVAERSLLMLDDVDKLTSEQRIHLSNTLFNLKIPLAIWLAERLEALKPEELLSPDATPGREYDLPIILEKFWRENQKKFETLLSDIANKRATLHRQYNITSFEYYLDDFLDREWDNFFNKAIEEESTRLIKKFGSVNKYKLLFDKCENPDEPLDRAAENWRLLEIIIERDKGKKQKKLFEYETLSYDEFNVTSKETDVAEFYIRYKYKIPYYYGFPKLVKLASSNIQQFLDISSDLFDEIISSKSFEKSFRMSASRQEQLLSKSVERYWEEIKMFIPHSKYLIPFLNSIGKFCFTETNFPAASYGPVTGIAISSQNVKILQNESVKETNPRYKTLSDIISTCLAYNLLEPLPDSRQGQKGTTHLILYLNRLLCFWYDLPLTYGGWKEQSLDTLCSFYESKFIPKRKPTLDFSAQRILEGGL